MLYLKNNLLNLHIVKDIIPFDRLTQWHNLLSHKTNHPN
jgi:hypothetical protein